MFPEIDDLDMEGLDISMRLLPTCSTSTRTFGRTRLPESKNSTRNSATVSPAELKKQLDELKARLA